MPQVSVIIPTYNGAKFVREAVDSVLRQTYRDYEIIVVDDGSTDGTQQLLAPLAKSKKIRYLYRDNGGPACARNAGIGAARGGYLAFLDADDVWLPEKLGLQMGLLMRRREYLVVHSDIEVCDADGRVLNGRLYDNPVREGWLFEEIMLLRSWIFLSSLLIERSVIARVGLFNEALPTAEDTNLFLRIARFYRAGYVGRVLVRRRSHGENMTEKGGLKIGTFRNLDDIAERFPELRPAHSALMRKAYSLRYALLGYTAFRAGRHLAARPYFRKALAYWPSNLKALAYYAATILPAFLLCRVRQAKRGLLHLRCGLSSW